MANVVEILVKGKDQFSGPAKSAQTSAGGLKGAMGGLGKMAVGVGAGFIAAQASIAGVQKIMSASIGAAMKFEAQMAELRALTGTTAEDTKILEGNIKDLARALPKSPEELGSAAYFILSSGIEDVSDATKVLEIAAKASTIGLGETTTVADALTTVLNAYGMSADKAGHVTDVMIAAVKEGKAEAGAFAGVLGRVVPLAAQMGISFEEVSANLATFTLLGVSAEEAATGLRAVMASLLKPTTDQQEAMSELGLSAEDLRQQIREKGLLATLDDMMTATGGNEAAVARLFPNIRALTSVLGTAGVQMDSYRDILGATEDATGGLEEGLAIVSDTAQHKVQMAMQELNLVLMELGQDVLPFVAAGAEKTAGALDLLVGAVEAIIWPYKQLDAAAVSAGDTTRDFLGLTVGLDNAIERQRGTLVADILAMREGRQTTADIAEETAEFDTQVAALASRLGLEEKLLRGTGLSMGELKDKTKELDDLIARTPATWQAFDKAIAESDATALELSGDMKNEVGPTTVIALESIEQAAEDTRSALTNMFRETTAEEAAAELALADLKLEAGRLEAKVGDLTAAEAARLAKLNDELIPAQQDSLDLLRLEKDAVEKHALAQDTALSPMEAWRKKVEGQTLAVDAYDRKIRSIPAEVGTTISLGFRDFTAAQVAQMIGPGFAATLFPAQHGYYGDVTRPTLFLAGEAGQREHVAITPGGGGGGGGRTVILNGPLFEGIFLGDEVTMAEFWDRALPELERRMGSA